MTRILFVISVLIFALALYIYYLSINTLEFKDRTDTHLKIVTVANEINSYAKRAEGHLFLYLMHHDPVDREKFFKRMDSLQRHINSLAVLLNEKKTTGYSGDLKEMHDQALMYGDRLLEKYNPAGKNDYRFDFAGAKIEIDKFHNATSKIRKKAVSMVGTFSETLKDEQAERRSNISQGKNIVLIIGIACIGLLIFINIISKRMSRLNEQLKQYSYVDSLTGISNRRAYEEKLEMEWKRALREQTSLSILLLDVDSFKLVNDLHGHSYGDDCLVSIAKALQSCLNRPTDMVARYGGEEFAIILPNTSEAMMVAENCRQAVNQLPSPFTDNKKLSVTIGVGVITVTQETDKDMVIEKIDQALYSGKQDGKNKVVLAEF